MTDRKTLTPPTLLAGGGIPDHPESLRQRARLDRVNGDDGWANLLEEIATAYEHMSEELQKRQRFDLH